MRSDQPSVDHDLRDLSPAAAALSEREREILGLVATGASNRQIARKLSISPNTVKVHLRNTFSKLGVSSRTEATVLAIREGMITDLDLAVGHPESADAPGPRTVMLGQWRIRRPGPVAVLGVVLILAIGAVLLVWRAVSPSSESMPQAPPPRWEWTPLPSLPTARDGLATAEYQGFIYAIGGRVNPGVSGATERYDITQQTWVTLPEKPTPVSDVQAAVVGGTIYVPGGRLSTGEVTDAVEAFNPTSGRWERRSPLPQALSAYSLTAFEGKLYLFGGWNGRSYVASVYSYDPESDMWEPAEAMPTARGHGRAVAAGDGIFVLGGYDGDQPLAVNEFYLPSPKNQLPGEDTSPAWTTRSPMPSPRFNMGAASIGGIVHVVGGDRDPTTGSNFRYFPLEDRWEQIDDETGSPWSGLGLTAYGRQLYALGGRSGEQITNRNAVLEAMHILFIPVAG